LDCNITESMIGEGCILKACRIHHSVLGIRSRIESGCTIEDSLLMGSDFYESAVERESNLKQSGVPIGIGAGTTIRRAIIDKNARIGKNVMIINKENVQEANREDEGFYIRSGIVVVIKNRIIPDGMVI
jgi:glucose-1-phosphate adenylyltransferase